MWPNLNCPKPRCSNLVGYLLRYLAVALLQDALIGMAPSKIPWCCHFRKCPNLSPYKKGQYACRTTLDSLTRKQSQNHVHHTNSRNIHRMKYRHKNERRSEERKKCKWEEEVWSGGRNGFDRLLVFFKETLYEGLLNGDILHLGYID